MAPLTKITFLVIAISFFLTIPSNAFDYTLKVALSTPNTPKTPIIPKPRLPAPKVVAVSQNVPAFVKASLVSTMAKTQDFIKNVIDKRLASSAPIDHYKKDCFKTCKEVYEDAIDSMKKATQDVKELNYYKANMDIGASYTYLDTCRDCIVDTKDHEPAFEAFDRWAKAIASDCLSKVSKEYYKN
ncbi:uncharacterized protein LOC107016005 [Solanum pennellii]|uniref:Uncharacterized protein LOC107016005 n=1 Tax=Solanum pennellii TaxID=28526 RepID=A0ABM1GJM0_SOLPN|nr:uncharacterized protein LOC107016005 [Solanum pennellii]